MREMNSDKGWVDIHTHILPGVDDGAGDWEETITLLKMAYEQGTRHLIATPHFSRRQEVGRLKELCRRLEREAGSISSDYHVSLGQEIMYFESILEYLGEGKALTLAGSRYVLVEFAPGDSFGRISRAVRQLVQASYFPVIAHVERYPCLARDELLKELIDYGAYLQVNFKSLTGVWMDKRLRWCSRNLKKGYIHVLATDMHNIAVRPPGMQEGILWLKRNAGEEKAIRILRENPEFILADRMLL